ncbi:MAG: MarR family winged helix-turn-helix transcriptional regulator [Ilumatobacteraceae bacterium]
MTDGPNSTSSVDSSVDSSPAWLSPDQLRAWVTMAAFLETVPSAIDNQLKRDTGVNRFEYTMLAMLSEDPDHTLVMSDLASVAFGSLSRLSHAASRLEQRGWVERCAGSGGRRHNVVRLTDEGHAALVEAAPGHVAEVRRVVVDPLDDHELATLRSLLAKMISAADPELGAVLDDLVENVAARNAAADG